MKKIEYKQITRSICCGLRIVVYSTKELPPEGTELLVSCYHHAEYGIGDTAQELIDRRIEEVGF